MPADQPSGPNRAWKDQVSPPDKAKGKRPWQKAPDKRTGPKGPWSNKTKLVIATGAVSAIVGLIIGVALYFKPPKPACLVLVGNGYEFNLAIPHNAYGMNALKALDALAPQTGVIESWWPWADAKTLRREARGALDAKRHCL